MSWQIPVFSQEKKDGLVEKIRANASIAYCHKASPLSEARREKIFQSFQKSKASEDRRNQPDLYYLDTILVTSCINKNDDIFSKYETWAARNTAEDKPFNFGHNQLDIIGHITANMCVNEDYELIDDASAMEDIPDKFHILTSAVIYKAWEDEAQAEKIEKIIAEIPEGKWFVSMECLFRGFDYGLTSASGEQRVIARNEESSFLTKYLRAYGGKGKYKDYSIGRVLKNITFSGKGLVENPANPESIIFHEVATFKSVFTDMGYIKLSSDHNVNDNKEITMANENSDVVTITKAELDALKSEAKAATAKIVDELKAEVNTLKAAVDKSKEDVKVAQDAAKAAKDEAEAAVKAKEQAEAERDAERANLKEITRVAAHIAKTGATEDEAKAFVKTWASVSDEQFASVLSLVPAKVVATPDKPAETSPTKPAKAAKSKSKDDEDDEDDDEDDDAMANEQVLEGAQAEKNVQLGASTNSEVESTRANLSNFLGNVLNKNRSKSKKTK